MNLALTYSYCKGEMDGLVSICEHFASPPPPLKSLCIHFKLSFQSHSM